MKSPVLVVILLTAVVACAQTEGARISGRVTDPTDAVIAGAECRITNLETNVSITTTTNQDGIYVIPGLRPATYRLLFGTYVSGGKIMPRSSEERAAAKDSGIDTFNALARAVSRCVPDVGDPFPLAVEVWCALHGYVSLQSVMPSFPFPAPREFMSDVVPALLRRR